MISGILLILREIHTGMLDVMLALFSWYVFFFPQLQSVINSDLAPRNQVILFTK